ncbi:phage portal protein [Vibrio vulnificus]|uniref:phage portal protein n=1 Tax=Vibrio vulnificus TaxID=672 RepID=UPI0019D48C51|nr:phage portal protein [Vibrio vulnificus]MBN8090490.1 phage portal protein [Vibrio vulnificus]MBN8119325.1 phage portal protein [Vibrio vulnificus]
MGLLEKLPVVREHYRLKAAYEALMRKGGKRPPAEKKLAQELAKISQLPLAQQARWFEENYPIVASALDEVVKNVVGPEGLTAQPQPKTNDGKVATEFAKEIQRAYEQAGPLWCMDGRTSRADSEQLICRAIVRDGEIFSRVYSFEGHDYLGDTPFAIEPFECDHIPADLYDKKNSIVNGFKLGEYNRTKGYFFVADLSAFVKKPVFIEVRHILHTRWQTRVSGLRGISKLAPALLSIHNLKEYEDAVRLGRLVAARIVLIHKKKHGAYVPGQDDEDDDDYDEPLSFEYGNVLEANKDDEFQTLESAKGAESSDIYIQHQQRNITGTVGANNSAVTGIYNKSYSAQRQEMIDRWAGYIILRALMVRQHVRPAYELWLNAAVLSGTIKPPKNLDWSTLYDVSFIGPVMPWIDPYKEANSIKILKEIGMLPLTKALAERGLDVNVILEMYRQEKETIDKLELTDVLSLVANANVNKTEKDDDEEE